MSTPTFQETYDNYKQMVNRHLEDYCKKQPHQGNLQEAMAYSLLGSGKRLRPVLTLATCELFGGNVEDALPFAAAVEMIHTYSLIHDDLPAMDNDDLRRGKPTSHKQFDEATAILAGDGLLTSAFMMASSAPLSPDKVVVGMHCLASLSGEQGMVGGQALERSEGTLTLPKLQQIQSLKTGALLVASCHLGCIAAGAEKKYLQAVTVYAGALGRAFQIRDDILDATGDQSKLGKPVGSDVESGIPTFYSLLGEAKAQELVKNLTVEAQTSLRGLPRNKFLCDLVQMLADRDH